jgi:glycosyltransferase involved in cell wall biosynthesis
MLANPSSPLKQIDATTQTATDPSQSLEQVQRMLLDCADSMRLCVAEQLSLSIVVPVFNEAATIETVINKLLELPIDKEIIIVDDGSSDGTREILASCALKHAELLVIEQPTNQGKGAALQVGFANCHGDVVIIQDADLEYDPIDILNVIAPIQDGSRDVVFGSRYLDPTMHCDQSFIHRAGNAFLTTMSNLFTGQKLTDMETAYKAFRREVIQSIAIEQPRFGFEPEITAKLSARKIKIGEVPISYSPRSWSEGKKIGWRDLVNTLYCIVRYRFKRS